jgi:putative two-component system response regulator
MAENEDPDVIIVDAMMPKLSGYDVIQLLKKSERTKLIPVIMVTALSNLEDRVKALEAGANDFLTKPVNKLELKARVKSLVTVKAYHNFERNRQQALENEVARKTAELQNAFSEVEAAYQDTVYRLALAAEFRDENTGMHIKRISRVTAAIARKLGIDSKTSKILFYASPLHDVGKIGIPDTVLFKTGKLSSEEWDIMRQHTTIGATILKDSPSKVIQAAQIIALTHHERWDGTGYPNQLKGKAIPIEGRIVAIVDVLDALLSKRAYKDAFSVEKSLAIIKAGSGTHFDPDVVSAFFSVKDEILETYRGLDIIEAPL